MKDKLLVSVFSVALGVFTATAADNMATRDAGRVRDTATLAVRARASIGGMLAARQGLLAARVNDKQ
jgi:hypothetical protein